MALRRAAVMCAMAMLLVLSGAAKPSAPSFALTLRRAPNDEATIIAPSNAVEHSVAEAGDALRHEWKFPAGSPVEHVHAEVRESGDEARYRLDVRVADGWHLEKRRFPEIEAPLVGVNGAQRLFIVGRGNGGYGHALMRNSSNGNSSGAFAATWDDAEGVYFGVEDACCENRSVGFWDEPSGRMLAEEVVGWRTGEVCTDYDVVVKTVRRRPRRPPGRGREGCEEAMP